MESPKKEQPSEHGPKSMHDLERGTEKEQSQNGRHEGSIDRKGHSDSSYQRDYDIDENSAEQRKEEYKEFDEG